MTGKRIGYVRVSTLEQNPERQLEKIPVDKKFIDYASAKSTDRPQLKAMLDFVREDDIVIVHTMDRLARNLKDLKNLVDYFIEKKIQVHFIKENLIFDGKNSPLAMLMLHMMGAFAEFEYAFIKERQREGVEIAKRYGRFKGGKRKLNREKIETMKNLLFNTRKTKTEIAQDLGVSRCTLYKYMKEAGIETPSSD